MHHLFTWYVGDKIVRVMKNAYFIAKQLAIKLMSVDAQLQHSSDKHNFKNQYFPFSSETLLPHTRRVPPQICSSISSLQEH